MRLMVLVLLRGEEVFSVVHLHTVPARRKDPTLYSPDCRVFLVKIEQEVKVFRILYFMVGSYHVENNVKRMQIPSFSSCMSSFSTWYITLKYMTAVA